MRVWDINHKNKNPNLYENARSVIPPVIVSYVFPGYQLAACYSQCPLFGQKLGKMWQKIHKINIEYCNTLLALYSPGLGQN